MPDDTLTFFLVFFWLPRGSLSSLSLPLFFFFSFSLNKFNEVYLVDISPSLERNEKELTSLPREETRMSNSFFGELLEGISPY